MTVLTARRLCPVLLLSLVAALAGCGKRQPAGAKGTSGASTTTPPVAQKKPSSPVTGPVQGPWSSDPERLVLRGHTGAVYSVALSADGERVLSGGNDQTARLWEVATGRQVCLFSGHRNAVTGVALSRDGRQALTGSTDGTARLWSTETGGVVRSFDHQGAVYSALFSPDDRTVLTLGVGAPGRLWSAETGLDRGRLEGTMPLFRAAFTADGQTVYTASAVSSTVRAHRVSDGKAFGVALTGRTASLSRDGRRLLACDGTQLARLLSLPGGALEGSYNSASKSASQVHCAALSPSGGLVALGGEKDVVLWEAGGKLVRRLEGHSGPVYALSFSADGRRLASGSDDRTVRVWDVDTGRELARLGDFEGEVYSVDWRYVLVYGYSDHTLRLWDVVERRQLRRLTGHGRRVLCASFSADGTRAVSAGLDGKLIVWNVGTGAQEATVEHKGTVRCVAVSPDGRQVLTAGPDQMVRLWSTAGGPELKTFRPGEQTVTSLTFSPDGKKFVCTTGAREAQLWGTETATRLDGAAWNEVWVQRVMPTLVSRSLVVQRTGTTTWVPSGTTTTTRTTYVPGGTTYVPGRTIYVPGGTRTTTTRVIIRGGRRGPPPVELSE
jgi:WD40 repeat protein